MKNFILVFLAAVLISSIASGQAITTDPVVVVTGKVIKIFFDTSKDNNQGKLQNYTGDLYAHTGVTLKHGTTWMHVIGTWGDNTKQPKLTKIGTYQYELDITPDIASFYSLALTDTVTQIDLVFRSSDASKQTKPDIFISVFQPGLNASITLPVNKTMVVELNSTIPVQASATLADSITLYINNQYIRSGSTPDSLIYSIMASQYGDFWVKAVAWKKPAFAADSFFVYVRRPLDVESLPAGLNDGINYTGPTSVTLVLLAPYKYYAFAMGDFNGWRAGDSSYMKVTPDGQRYWLAISGLIPGKEYRFQYLVDSTLIAEPYCDKVLDPDNDQYISASTYPNLIQYPRDTTTGLLSVLQTNQQPYNWKTTAFQPPQKTKLVIYELLVRDFVATHCYKTIADTLDYLQRLGVNAIEIMPLTEFEGNSSWGYNVSFYFAPDKYYGPKNTLKALVDSCHSRGIAVIMDLVMNDCFGSSPFVQLYLNYYAPDQIIMKLPNPWFNAISPNPVYHWGADFNHESPETQKFVDRVTSYWMTEYHIDGFRFDFAKGYTNTPGDGSAYDASRIAILKRIANKIWSVNSNAYVILELFADNSEEKVLAEYGMMPWGNMNSQYCQAAMGYASDLTWGTSLARTWTAPNLVSYMESHDEERMMYQAVNYGNANASYNIKDVQTALKRMELSTVFFLTIPGPKMIWQFGELGYDISINYNTRTGEKPILWNYYNQMPRYRLYLIYEILNKLRKTQDAFSTSSYTYSFTGMQKSLQLNSAGTSFDVLGNFDIVPAPISPAFQQTGKWYEYFTDDSITVAGVNDPITLQPSEYRLYTTTRLSSPKNILGVKDINASDAGSFATVYPNPSGASFYFEITGIQPSDLTISIFDISGRIIRQITGRISSPEKEKFTWDGRTTGGDEAGKGMYFARITAGMKSEVIRLIKN
jgi:Alpha amylase, catalytic domain